VLGPSLFVAFLLFMGVAWVFANPPGYAPDEPAHYVKAIGVGRGQFVGRPGAYPIGPGFGPLQLQWINKASRQVDLPPGRTPGSFACSVFNPTISAYCLNAPQAPEGGPFLTYVGTYEPFLYAAPGLAMTGADNAVTALLLGRSVSALISLGLLAAAAFVLMIPGAGARSLIGLTAAATPMVVFLAAELGPTGTEICAAICVTAVFLRLARDRSPTSASEHSVPRWIWPVAAFSGLVLVTSRSLGPVFLVALVGLFVVAAGPRGAVDVLRRGGRWATAAGAAVSIGIIANLAWGIAVQPHPSPGLRSVLSWVGPSVREVPEVLRQDIGSFGWADVNMPRAAYLAWGLMVVGLVVMAFVIGQRRQRVLLAVAIAGCFAGTVALAAAVIHQTYFPMYGRYALPMWITVPLIAGEIVMLNRRRLPPSLLTSLSIGVPLVAAAVHATGWYVNGRRYAVSDYGPVLWPGHSEWAPRGGWEPWFVVVILAVACLVGSGILSAREDDAPVRS